MDSFINRDGELEESKPSRCLAAKPPLELLLQSPKRSPVFYVFYVCGEMKKNGQITFENLICGLNKRFYHFLA